MEEWDEYLAVVVGKQEYVEQDNAVGVLITVRTPDKDYTLKVDKESYTSLSLFDTVSILVSPKGEAVLGTRDKPHQLIIHHDEK